jgi:serine/threonine protein kinase/Tfp pilus assembly protein PilF
VSGERTGSASDVTQREFVGGQKVFGRYTLVKILGRGGMGIVWLARDEELERDVALKFLPDVIVRDRALLDELKRETRRSLELTHKNIVRIHDFVFNETSGCISMEYVDGETLSNLRAEKEQKVFEPNDIANWTSQLCDALDYAHNQARIVHRDLKPANLMVTQSGDLKVSDFGIARSLGDTVSRLTREQGRSGTLVYMSPQQLDGERGTHLDDIYSLGATLYELLTSKPPFYSGNLDRQIHERVAPSMTERRKDLNIEPASVPATWEEVVVACLAKDPAKRPQSTAEVAKRLQLDAPRRGWARSITITRQKKKALAVIAIATLFVIGLIGLYFGVLKRHGKPLIPPAAQTAAIPEKSIAVLPFENLSEQKENAYFADGVQNEILTDLAKIADLKVISRTSVMQYKSGITRNLKEIAQQLGVANVLEGSVQRAAGKVRVNAQLIDARADKHLWAKTYDRDLADVFAIETEVAQSIANELQAKLSASEKVSLEEKPTQDLAAYDFYVRAIPLIDGVPDSSTKEKDLSEAVDLLNQAIARDPAFVLAYCRLALAHDTLYFQGVDRTPERLALAKSAIDSAFRLKPDSGEAHLALAWHLYYGYFDYDRARTELAIAQRTLPNNPRVFEFAGIIDRRQGRWANVIRDWERASELDPRSVSALRGLAVTYYLLREYDQVNNVLTRILVVNPKDLGARLDRTFIEVDWRADTRPLRGEIEKILAEDPAQAENDQLKLPRYFLALFERDAVAADRAALALPQKIELDEIELSRDFWVGVVARMKGDAAAARTAFTTARAQQEETVRARPAGADSGPLLSGLGMIDAGLGRKEEALREGRRAIELAPVAKNSLDGAAVLSGFALICAWTGERDLAIEQLEAFEKIPGGPSYGDLRLSPVWDSLRGDPRFEKVMAEAAKPVKLD